MVSVWMCVLSVIGGIGCDSNNWMKCNIYHKGGSIVNIPVTLVGDDSNEVNIFQVLCGKYESSNHFFQHMRSSFMFHVLGSLKNNSLL